MRSGVDWRDWWSDEEARLESVEAVGAAIHPHHFLAVTKAGESAIARTTGNGDCHVILRGGTGRPNYDAESVEAAAEICRQAGQVPSLMIDASHANSGKDPARQPAVMADVAQQIAGGESRITGVMIESNLVAGNQSLVPGQPLTYGQSITDGCIDWETSVTVIEELAAAVARRRQRQAAAS